MADITYSLSIKVDKGFLSSSVNANSVTATMSVAGLSGLTLALTTNTASVSTATLTAPGVAFVRNLSTTTSDTAQMGVVSSGTFLPFSTLRGGEAAILRLTSGTEYAAKGVAGTRLRVDITEG